MTAAVHAEGNGADASEHGGQDAEHEKDGAIQRSARLAIASAKAGGAGLGFPGRGETEARNGGQQAAVGDFYVMMLRDFLMNQMP